MKKTKKQTEQVEKETSSKEPASKKVKKPAPQKEKEVQPEKEPVVKKQQVYSLTLSRFELLHLRDLMGILLPPDGAQTLSQALAASEERTLIESMLWEKMTRLCAEAELPLGSEAPDYIVAPIAPPPMGVFLVSQDVTTVSDGTGFVNEDEED